MFTNTVLFSPKCGRSGLLHDKQKQESISMVDFSKVPHNQI